MLHHRNVNRRIDYLQQLSRAELRVLWEREFADKPPPSLGRDILALGIAYALQERRHGGLARPVAKELDRLLARVLRDDAANASQLLPTPLPRTGTVLVREWHGATHRVTVADDGFLWNGETYRSLSSIARAITGTKWNGPRFFGMREAKRTTSETRHGPNERKFLRCAVYTRKSSEHGLEQDFNSLDAQREAAEAYIKSQAHEGWRLVKGRYDDGGLSGGTLERPALQLLLDDIRARKIDVVVVYKVDRLTRSLADFAKLVELFEGHGVSFVAVTQQFNTTTSMGRLTLNVLLSFAQFERELAGERIRDKFAASRRKGMWMGGTIPLGYDVKDRKLIINADEAARVRLIFQRYLAIGCVSQLREDLEQRGVRSKQRVLTSGQVLGGCSFGRGALYHLLQNRIYLGEVVHKGVEYPGEQARIVAEELWNAVQTKLEVNRGARRRSRVETGALLGGLIFDDRGNLMSPTYSIRRGNRYRYYISRALVRGRREDSGSHGRVGADDVERLVVEVLSRQLSRPELMNDVASGTWSPKTRAIVRDAVERVVVGHGEVQIIHKVATTSPSCDQPSEDGETPKVHIVRVPVPQPRARKEIIIPGGHERTPRRLNHALVLAIARGKSWMQDLRSGKYADTEEIARRFKLNDAHVRRILRLGYLAPDIVEAIVEGRQPRSLTVKRLLQRIPCAWPDQRAAFGFTN